MNRLPYEKYLNLTRIYGLRPGKFSGDVGKIVLSDILHRNASTGIQSHAVEIPVDEQRILYSQFFSFCCTDVVDGVGYSGFKVWGPPDQIASGVTLYAGLVSGEYPGQKISDLQDLGAQHVNYYDEQHCLAVGGELRCPGEYSQVIELSCAVDPAASSGVFDGNVLNYTFEGYGQLLYCPFAGSLTDFINGISPSYSDDPPSEMFSDPLPEDWWEGSLLLNGNFEDGIDDWNAVNAVLSASQDYTVGGVYALRVTVSSGVGYAEQVVEAIPSLKYRASGSVLAVTLPGWRGLRVVGAQSGAVYFDSADFEEDEGGGEVSGQDCYLLERGATSAYLVLNSTLNGYGVYATKPAWVSNSPDPINGFVLQRGDDIRYLYLNSTGNGLTTSPSKPVFMSDEVAQEYIALTRGGETRCIYLNSTLTGPVIGYSPSAFNSFEGEFTNGLDTQLKIRAGIDSPGTTFFDSLALYHADPSLLAKKFYDGDYVGYHNVARWDKGSVHASIKIAGLELGSKRPIAVIPGFCELYIGGDDNLHFEVAFGAVFGGIASGSLVLPDNAVIDALATWDAASGIALYLDGELVGSVEMTWGAPPVWPSDVRVGGNGAGLSVNALLRDVAIYNNSLSGDRVAEVLGV